MTSTTERLPTPEPDSRSAVAVGRDFSVTDKVVVITGAGQGIGREYARQFALAGAVPIVADVNDVAGQRVVDEITTDGGRALFVGTDISDPDSVQAMVKSAVGEFGRVDALVNNAAIFSSLTMRRFDEIPLDEWQRVLNVNITGAFLCAREVLPHMLESGWGRIVNITSGAVPTGSPNYLHYVASKSALYGMTYAMARELGNDGITVNAVQPGGTFTEIPRETITEAGKAVLLTKQCIGREEKPMDLVGLVMFLCSRASGFITGQAMAVDGGLTHR